MLFNDLGNEITGSYEVELSRQDQSDIIGVLITESATEGELEEMLDDKEDIAIAEDEGVLTEATIIKLDKKAKFKRAQLAAIFKIARQKKDKKMKLLELLWKRERPIMAYLKKKYSNEAAKSVKKAMSTASKSNSKLVKKAIARSKASINQK